MLFEIITLQSVLYATVSDIPSPGAIGVSEGGFLPFPQFNLYERPILKSAMLLNRGINFYLPVIISSIIVIINTIRRQEKAF